MIGTYSTANGNSKQNAEINAAEKLLKKISKKKLSRIIITGFPNAGKSSLINLLLKKKTSIVLSKIQTTNIIIQAVLNYENCQMISTDTPGILKKLNFIIKNSLEKFLKTLRELEN